jgi:5-(carboxyamino)imidazole ribonucleotide synthase
VSKTFPTVGLFGSAPHAGMYISPALSLGVELLQVSNGTQEQLLGDAKKCDVVSFIGNSISPTIANKLEADGFTVRPSFAALSNSTDAIDSKSDQDPSFCVMVARSPHGQATTWAPTEIVRSDKRWVMSVTPARYLTTALQEKVQQIALDFSAKIGAVGVIALEMSIKEQEAIIKNVEMHPHASGNWTVGGSITSQYEQHLRAILDLPLGEPSMSAKYVVTANIYCGDKPNMYRPYLHLMARTPALKFHQYKGLVNPGDLTGHITLAGDDVDAIIEEVRHAVEYMQGEIDE